MLVIFFDKLLQVYFFIIIFAQKFFDNLIINKYMKKTILFFFATLLLCNVQAQTLYYTSTPPVIGDGVIDDVWKIATPHVNTFVMAAQDGSAGREGDGKTQIENPAGQWRVLYDETNFYFLVEVQDNTPINNSPTIDNNVCHWAGDGIEIFLSQLNNSNQRQIGFGYQAGKTNKTYGNNMTTAYWNSMNWNITPITNNTLNINGVSSYNGYFLEVSIPQSVIGITSPITAPFNVNIELGINQSAGGNARAAQILMQTTADNLWNSTGSYASGTAYCDKAIKIIDVPTAALCEGESFTLNTDLKYTPSTTTTNPSSDPNPTYQWERKLSSATSWTPVTGTTTLTENNLTSGNYQYRVTIDYRTSCTVNVSVGASFQLSEPTYKCIGNDILLTSAAPTGSGQTSFEYAIYNGGNEIFIDSNTFIVPQQEDTYRIVAKDPSGCQVTSDPLTISLPQSIAVEDITAVCNGTTSTLTVRNHTGYIYAYNGVSFQRDSIFENIPIPPTSQEKYYYIVVKDNATNCQTDTFKVEKPYIPDFTLDFECSDETTLVVKPIQDPLSSYAGTYKYYLDGASTETNLPITISPVENGSHKVRIQDITGCETEVSKDFAKPTVSLTPATDQELKAGDPDLEITATSSESIYQWKKGNNLLDETSDSYTVDVNNSIGTTAEYSVKAKAANGCYSDPASVKVTVTRSDLPNAIDISAGINDVNRVFAAGTGKELYIFNRYGTTVYKEIADNVTAMKGWNGCYDNKQGKEVEPGVYYYVLTVGDDTAKGAVEVVKSK
jgi:hypothetical protein